MQTINFNGLSTEEQEVIALSVRNGIRRGSLDNLTWTFASEIKENDILLQLVILIEEGFTSGHDPAWSLTFKRNVNEYLREPLTHKQIIEIMDENRYVEGIVAVDLDEVINNDFSALLDSLSTKLVNSECLMDISLNVVGLSSDNDEILIQVSGDASSVLDEEENEEEVETKLLCVIRERQSENQSYMDYYLVPKDEQEPEQLLRKAIRAFLVTKEGFEKIKNTSNDFNWGDTHYVPRETWKSFGVQALDTYDQTKVSLYGAETIIVDQDELLIPDEYWNEGEETV